MDRWFFSLVFLFLFSASQVSAQSYYEADGVISNYLNQLLEEVPQEVFSIAHPLAKRLQTKSYEYSDSDPCGFQQADDLEDLVLQEPTVLKFLDPSIQLETPSLEQEVSVDGEFGDVGSFFEIQPNYLTMLVRDELQSEPEHYEAYLLRNDFTVIKSLEISEDIAEVIFIDKKYEGQNPFRALDLTIEYSSQCRDNSCFLQIIRNDVSRSEVSCSEIKMERFFINDPDGQPVSDPNTNCDESICNTNRYTGGGGTNVGNSNNPGYETSPLDPMPEATNTENAIQSSRASGVNATAGACSMSAGAHPAVCLFILILLIGLGTRYPILGPRSPSETSSTN